MPRPRPMQKEPMVAAVAGFLVAAAAAFCFRGLAGDEEPGHFLVSRYAPGQPALFLSLFGRPLVTIALCLPAQGGWLLARLASAVATGFCAYAVARIVVSARWTTPWWAVGLLLVQPFYLAHAGTAMTEPWAAAILAWGLLAYVERRLLLFAILGALCPLARLETVAFWPFVVWGLLRNRRPALLAILPIGVLLWNVGGGLWSGDPLWLFHQSAWMSYPVRPVFHYLRSFVWIVGIGLFVPIVVAVVRALAFAPAAEKKVDAQTAAFREDTVKGAGIFLVMFFGVYTALATWHPITFGNLRYFAYAAPAFAVLAAAGLHAIAGPRGRWTWIALGLAGAGALFVWDHVLIADFGITKHRDFVPVAVAAVWLGLFALPVRFRRAAPIVAVVLGAAVLPARYPNTLHVHPRPEESAARLAVSMAESALPRGSTLYTAHPLIAFFRGENLYDHDIYPAMTDRAIETAPLGSALFWETHYAVLRGESLTTRPFFENDSWRYVNGVVSADSLWAGGYFVKVDPADTTAALPAWAARVAGDGMSEDVWRQTTVDVQAGIPQSRHNVEQDPTNASLWRTLGQRLGTVGRFNEAWAALQRAAALDPGNAYNYAHLAEMLRFRGKPAEGYREAQHALSLRPDDGTILYLNAQLLMDLGRDADAVEPMVRAAERLDKRWDVQFAAAQLLYQQEDWERADRFLAVTKKLRPQHVRAAVMSAEISWRLGQKDEGLQKLRDFIRRRPMEPAPYVILGDLLVGEGRPDEAKELWRAGLEETGDPDIASRLESLSKDD